MDGTSGPHTHLRRAAVGSAPAEGTRAARSRALTGRGLSPVPAAAAPQRSRRRETSRPGDERGAWDDAAQDAAARASWEQAQVKREIERSERLLRREARNQEAFRARAEREEAAERRRLAEEVRRMRSDGWTWEELADVGIGPGFLAAFAPPPPED
ncbi:MAG TPA: hypothetical protein VFE05_04770 [Longimicrobiaceae bacterium]|nr:hypothetical protein [Longimicrobiaceae bacterium]